MPIRLDHLIMAGDDLSALESMFTRLGFFVTGGGEHPHLGTRNRLIILGETYLELLAVGDAAAVSPALRQRIAAGPGWVGFAVQAEDIEAEVVAMRSRAVEVQGPRPGRLVSSEGHMRSWRTASLGGDDFWAAALGPLPFLIQHDTSGEAHQRALAGAGGLLPHPNGARSVVAATVVVDDLHAASLRYKLDYNLTPLTTAKIDDTLSAVVIELPLGESGQRIVLAQPVDEEGPLWQRLTTTGEGLYRVTVAVDDLGTTRAYLEQQHIRYEARGEVLLLPAAETAGAPLLMVESRR